MSRFKSVDYYSDRNQYNIDKTKDSIFCLFAIRNLYFDISAKMARYEINFHSKSTTNYLQTTFGLSVSFCVFLCYLFRVLFLEFVVKAVKVSNVAASEVCFKGSCGKKRWKFSELKWKLLTILQLIKGLMFCTLKSFKGWDVLIVELFLR